MLSERRRKNNLKILKMKIKMKMSKNLKVKTFQIWSRKIIRMISKKVHKS